LDLTFVKGKKLLQMVGNNYKRSIGVVDGSSNYKRFACVIDGR
jgi:hypothetical protein